ncbi:Membrane-associated protein gex-3 [Thelohanellus kitauei]|uniref:Membrane-associated protein gex-3 n=1 Tax=Thelohanellus kitauei TaxID=669202 RepID=A0A0C2MPB8_THEKT|nr:Membrane-associated protein gex-3 [Thelohanellus kitauei]
MNKTRDSAEELYLLESSAENTLNGLYHFHKTSISTANRPKCLSQKNLDAILKKIAKKFPLPSDFIHKENCSELIKSRLEILEETQSFYNIMRNFTCYKETAINLLTSAFSVKEVCMKSHTYIAVGILQVLSTLIRGFYIINKIEDLTKLIGVYGLVYQSIHNSNESSYISVCKLIQDYNDPLAKLSEDLSIGETMIQNILCGLIDDFRPCILEGKQLQTNYHFNLSVGQKSMSVPYCTILYPNLLKNEAIESVVNVLIVQNMVVPLHRDMHVNYFKELTTAIETRGKA